MCVYTDKVSTMSHFDSKRNYMLPKSVSTGGRPGRPSPTSDRTSIVVDGKGAHARPECPSDGLAPRTDV